jgi:hypothetical protein
VRIKPFSEFFETTGIRWKRRGEEETGDGKPKPIASKTSPATPH